MKAVCGGGRAKQRVAIACAACTAEKTIHDRQSLPVYRFEHGFHPKARDLFLVDDATFLLSHLRTRWVRVDTTTPAPAQPTWTVFGGAHPTAVQGSPHERDGCAERLCGAESDGVPWGHMSGDKRSDNGGDCS